LITGSLLPLWWTDLWWVRLWDFPRLQVAGLLFIAAIALYFVGLGRWRWPLLAGSLVALGWQVSHFLAYLPPYPKQVASAASCPPEREFSLLNANVLMTNRDYPALLRLVEQRQPDILLLLETDEAWEKAIEPLKRVYRYDISEAIPNTYGLILMSRLPMTGRIRHRLQPDIPSAEATVRLRDDSAIRLHAIHPEPPLPGDDSGERDAELVMVGRQVRDEGQAAIIVGDLNDVAWSHTSGLFRRLGGMNDPRVGRGLYPTFTAKYPLLRWPLDHLFVSPHFELLQIDLLPKIGSDHFPIFFRLCLKSNPSKRKVAPSAPASTEIEAEEQLQEGKSENREENRVR
jgi:endonuclease/exonuclease/phosphatase (EEP) superfamily protein YafD